MRILLSCCAVVVLAATGLAAEPKTADEFDQRGLRLAMKGMHEEAVADFTEAVRLDPKHANVLCNRGVAQLNKGEYEKAVADFEAALRLNPKLQQAQTNLDVAKQKLKEKK